MNKFIKIITSEQFILTVVIIVIALILFALASHAQKKLKLKNIQNDSQNSTEGTFKVVFTIIKYVILFIAFLAILQVNGISLGTLIASLGLTTAVVAYAFQDLLKDLLMSVHISSDKSFKIGDVIKYGDIEGEVLSYNLRSTVIRNLADDSVTYVSNRNLDTVTRMSGMLNINVPLSYEENVSKIHKVLQETAEDIDKNEIVKSCSYKGTQEFCDSAINYRIQVVCKNPTQKYDVHRLAISSIQKHLNEANITIPYNQIDVHQR